MKYTYLAVSFLLLTNFASLTGQETISIGVSHTIKSSVLNEDRTISVHVPSGFYGMDETNLRYPVLYLLDGEALFLPTVGITNQMSSPFTANDLLPKMIIVGIPNSNRNRDLSPSKAMIANDPTTIENTGGASNFADFIEMEVIPYVDAHYPTVPHRSLLGHSLGGLFVLKTLIERPGIFNNYLCIDPDLSWDNYEFSKEVIDSLKEKQFINQRLFLASANTSLPGMTMNEVKVDTNDITRITKSNLLFSEQLSKIEPSGISFKEKYYESENHFQVPVTATYDGLRYLFADYSYQPMIQYYFPDSEQGKINLVQDITRHFNNLSNTMGYTVLPLESYINSWAFGFLSLGKFELTEELLDYNIENYPDSQNVHKAKETFLKSKKE